MRSNLLRLKPQFRLRALLILTAIAGAIFVWSVPPPKGKVSVWQASKVKVGMSRDEVISMLGEPVRTTIGDPPTVWSYVVSGPIIGDGHLTVHFNKLNKRVSQIERAEYQGPELWHGELTPTDLPGDDWFAPAPTGQRHGELLTSHPGDIEPST